MHLSRSLKAFFVFFAFSGASIFGQHLDFGFDAGVKGGVPFTNLLQTTGTITTPTFLNQSSGYLIGPVVEMRIPFGFAIEVDGIYRHSQSTATANGASTTLNANAWEIPYLAKFRFPIPLLKPFISGGGAYRTFTNLNSNITPSHNAFVLGGGLELRISKLRLSGEARWLYWGNTSTTSTPVKLARNQGELLFGLVF
jgi:hypothetical protein